MKLLLAHIGRLWRRFTKKQRNLSYDSTQVTRPVKTDQGESDVAVGLTEAGEKQRKELLKTHLQFGDTYQLGPNARVTVGPPGLAGKAWIEKRVKANTKKRADHFDRWWAEKRAKCMRIMMMSEQELIDSGIKAEVDAFLKENESFITEAKSRGLWDEKTKLTTKSEVQPSGQPEERVESAFSELMERAGLVSEEVPVVATPDPLSREAFLKRREEEKNRAKG